MNMYNQWPRKRPRRRRKTMSHKYKASAAPSVATACPRQRYITKTKSHQSLCS